MNADKTLLTPLCKRLGATLSRRGMLFVGLGIVIIMSAAALLAPWLSPYDPTALHLKSILVPPSAQFPLGTDALGRDVLSRLLYGARVSLWVGSPDTSGASSMKSSCAASMSCSASLLFSLSLPLLRF